MPDQTTPNAAPTPSEPSPAQAPAPEISQSQEEEDLEAQLAYENLKKRREARKRKRIIIVAIIVVVALVGVVIYFVSQAQSASEDETIDMSTQTVPITKDDFTTTVSANGATEPLNSTVVTPEIDGIIEGLRVEVGQYVNKGDVLFTIKNDKLDTGVREAQEQLDSAIKTRDRAAAAVDKANAAVVEAQDAADRAYEQAQGDDEEDSYDESALQSAITSAEEAVDSAIEAYDDAVSGVEKAQLALEDAQKEAEKRTVTAPVSGTIISMSAKEGGSVGGGEGGGGSSSEPPVQIVDLSKMKVTVQVNEIDISSIKVGQKAIATFSALPETELDAEVTNIASVSSGSSGGEGGGDFGGGGVVTYAVDLLIPHPSEDLKPGMTASVSIITQSVPNTFIVPTASVASDEEGSYVVVVDNNEDGEPFRVDVKVLAQNNSEAAIDGNLVEGDEVLVDPASATLSTTNEGVDEETLKNKELNAEYLDGDSDGEGDIGDSPEEGELMDESEAGANADISNGTKA